MKTKLLSIFSLVLLLTISSCKDNCKDVTCVNGACDEETGACVCNTGYEGSDCGTKMTDKFTGTYTVNENCSTGTYTYTVVITASSTQVDQIIINNMYDSGDNVIMTVDGSTATMESQVINGLTYSGSGSMNSANTSFTISYTVTDGISTDDCIAIAAKQ